MSPRLNVHFTSRCFGVSSNEISSAILELLKGMDGIATDKLSPSCVFEDVGLDSLAQIEMYTSLEEKFNIMLSDEDTEGVKSVGELVKIILTKSK